MFEKYKKLIINAVLAGVWAGIAAFQLTGEFSKAALYAAGAVAIRAAIGYVVENWTSASIPVDK